MKMMGQKSICASPRRQDRDDVMDVKGDAVVRAGVRGVFVDDRYEAKRSDARRARMSRRNEGGEAKNEEARGGACWRAARSRAVFRACVPLLGNTRARRRAHAGRQCARGKEEGGAIWMEKLMTKR